ncbi:Uncharacterized conserved protein, DUF1330 family [Acinetobacter marinus]|uniref:Uncharacterized conserved protein, DUF1330 family n=1 Tax=Acinetobacter marinus TaxID=281375 RepID=A0A1G6ILE3_9GAMM|nr:DUF1330 domain-containing protein [Acinetobacter marinus]SDC06586.1 Uncharacterized conserved protein, DUF1330 family [Acinetobacter marinus]
MRFLYPSLLSCAVVVSAFTASAVSAQTPSQTPAYYVAEFQATDREAIKPYSAQVESTFKPYSGRFVIRGGEADVKEGFGVQGRLVMIKFDSLKQAQDWYSSDAYQKLIPIRHSAGNSRTYIVEGLAE